MTVSPDRTVGRPKIYDRDDRSGASDADPLGAASGEPRLSGLRRS